MKQSLGEDYSRRLIRKTRQEWKKNSSGDWYSTGKPSKIIDIFGYCTVTPWRKLRVLTATNLKALIRRNVYIDLVKLYIPMDFVYEGMDWKKERELFTSYNPGSSSTLALHKTGHGVYVSIMGEAFNHDEDILFQTGKYLREIFEACFILPDRRTAYACKTTNSKEKTYSQPEGKLTEDQIFSAWIDAVQLKTIEICFPLGTGLPGKYLKKDGFHFVENTWYTDARSSKRNDSKEKSKHDHGKSYDMTETNPILREKFPRGFSKFEVVLTDRWVNLSLAKLEGSALDILYRFEKQVKEVLKGVSLRKEALTKGNFLFIKWFQGRAVKFLPLEKEKKIHNKLGIEKIIDREMRKDSSISVRKLLERVKSEGYQVSRGTVHNRMKEWEVSKSE